MKLNLTKQEIFDTVAAHLLKQGKRSIKNAEDFNGMCAYRGDNGLRCAIGCLIPDECYTTDMEGHSVSGLINRKLIETEHDELLLRLQRVHDTESPVFWAQKLSYAALVHGLNRAVLGIPE